MEIGGAAEGEKYTDVVSPFREVNRTREGSKTRGEKAPAKRATYNVDTYT